jgi:hypothetical protein
MDNNKLKLKFNGYESITENHSQAAQDLFVLSCLNGKRDGTFLDLGCHHPIHISNTYLLENKFGWNGVCIDIEQQLVSQFNGLRNCVALTEDCTKLDFQKIKSYYNSNHIDYLSLDLEPASVTLECLATIPFNEIEFSIITFEHDSYRFGNWCRDASRTIFEKHGYVRIASDVSNAYNIYEDWYYNPKYVSYDDIKIFETDSQEWSDIIFDK